MVLKSTFMLETSGVLSALLHENNTTDAIIEKMYFIIFILATNGTNLHEC
jgi:hypothetical protein